MSDPEEQRTNRHLRQWKALSYPLLGMVVSFGLVGVIGFIVHVFAWVMGLTPNPPWGVIVDAAGY